MAKHHLCPRIEEDWERKCREQKERLRAIFGPIEQVSHDLTESEAWMLKFCKEHGLDDMMDYMDMESRQNPAEPEIHFYKALPPKVECKTHGDVTHANIHIDISKTEDGRSERLAEAYYCQRCLMDALDKLVGRCRRC
jgi:hypothetical protein